jgi:hypothetical protein
MCEQVRIALYFLLQGFGFHFLPFWLFFICFLIKVISADCKQNCENIGEFKDKLCNLTM